MENFNTIHIFGFGDVQVIGQGPNGTVKAVDLTTLAAFVNHIKSMRPADVVELDYHVIHVFNGNEVRYIGTDGASPSQKHVYHVKFANIDPLIMKALFDEIVSKLI